jgi:hypothetical protein
LKFTNTIPCGCEHFILPWILEPVVPYILLNWVLRKRVEHHILIWTLGPAVQNILHWPEYWFL